MPAIVPRLGVPDLERELAFYEALGFELDERSEAHALVMFGEVDLALHRYDTWRVSDGPLLDWDRAPQRFGTGVQLYIMVDDVEEVVARIPVGVPRPWPVQDKPWGFRELTLRTPAGYLLTFAQRR